MDLTGLIIFLAIGALAGWLGSLIMKGGGFGLLGNIVIGALGAIYRRVSFRSTGSLGERPHRLYCHSDSWSGGTVVCCWDY